MDDDNTLLSRINVPLPPVKDIEKLTWIVERCPYGLQEDAVQEAWVAHLEGKNVYHAVDVFRVGEMRYNKFKDKLVKKANEMYPDLRRRIKDEQHD